MSIGVAGKADGVGELVSPAAEKRRATRPGIKLGVCGEHGCDPASIHFCEKVGLDYVSCSPYRVPISTARGGTGGSGAGANMSFTY